MNKIQLHIRNVQNVIIKFISVSVVSYLWLLLKGIVCLNINSFSCTKNLFLFKYLEFVYNLNKIYLAFYRRYVVTVLLFSFYCSVFKSGYRTIIKSLPCLSVTAILLVKYKTWKVQIGRSNNDYSLTNLHVIQHSQIYLGREAF